MHHLIRSANDDSFMHDDDSFDHRDQDGEFDLDLVFVLLLLSCLFSHTLFFALFSSLLFTSFCSPCHHHLHKLQETLPKRLYLRSRYAAVAFVRRSLCRSRSKRIRFLKLVRGTSIGGPFGAVTAGRTCLLSSSFLLLLELASAVGAIPRTEQGIEAIPGGSEQGADQLALANGPVETAQQESSSDQKELLSEQGVSVLEQPSTILGSSTVHDRSSSSLGKLLFLFTLISVPMVLSFAFD